MDRRVAATSLAHATFHRKSLQLTFCNENRYRLGAHDVGDLKNVFFEVGEIVQAPLRDQIDKPRGLKRRKIDPEPEICLTNSEPSTTGVRPSRC